MSEVKKKKKKVFSFIRPTEYDRLTSETRFGYTLYVYTRVCKRNTPHGTEFPASALRCAWRWSFYRARNRGDDDKRKSRSSASHTIVFISQRLL